jgi:hypothetical protein
MKRAAECKPGYGCLKCKLPPFECDYSGQTVFPEEKLMSAVVPRAPIAPEKKNRNVKDPSGEQSAEV